MSVQDSVTSVSNSLKVRLIILVFLQYAVWGTYLISIGRYLALAGLGSQIKWFFALNGLVSLFMPALMGIVSDRFIEAQRTLSVCHLLAGVFMAAVSIPHNPNSSSCLPFTDQAYCSSCLRLH